MFANVSLWSTDRLVGHRTRVLPVRVCVPYTFRSVYVLHTTEKEREEKKKKKEGKK